MTTKEKIVRQSIAAAEKERSEIIELLDASPLIGISEGRQKAREILCNYEIGDPRIVKEFTFLASEEKRLFDIVEKQQDSLAVIARRVKLEIELTGLRAELYWIEQQNYVSLTT